MIREQDSVSSRGRIPRETWSLNLGEIGHECPLKEGILAYAKRLKSQGEWPPPAPSANASRGGTPPPRPAPPAPRGQEGRVLRRVRRPAQARAAPPQAQARA